MQLRSDEMPDYERPLSERYRLAGQQWVALDAKARQFEEMKSLILAAMVTDLVEDGLPVTRAESKAKASDRYREHIEEMVDYRTKANGFKVELKAIEIEHSEQMLTTALARDERRMGR